MVGSPSPARLRHAGDLALERVFSQANPAHAKLAVVTARAAAYLAPIVGANLEFRFSPGLDPKRSLRH